MLLKADSAPRPKGIDTQRVLRRIQRRTSGVSSRATTKRDVGNVVDGIGLSSSGGDVVQIRQGVCDSDLLVSRK